MDQDGVEPGGKPAATIKTWQAPPRLSHGFGKEILGGMKVAAQRQRLLEQPRFMLDGATAKGIGIALPGSIKFKERVYVVGRTRYGSGDHLSC
jgi:hypothetical protein